MNWSFEIIELFSSAYAIKVDNKTEAIPIEIMTKLSSENYFNKLLCPILFNFETTN